MAIVTFCSKDVIASELPLRIIDMPYIWLVMNDEFRAQGNELVVRAKCISIAVVALEGTEQRRPLGIEASPKIVESKITVVLPAAGAVSFCAAALIELPLAYSNIGAWHATLFPRANATSECTESSEKFETVATIELLRVVDETVAWTTDDMHENPARCAVPPASSEDPLSADTSNRMLPMTFDTVCELSREGSATTLARDCRASLAELASKLLAFSLMAADTLLTMLPCKSCDANSLLPLFD